MTLYFPDISAFQAGLDLAGAKAVCSKVTEGTGWFSGDYARQKSNAASHNTYFTAYHFLHGGAPAAQAKWAHDHAGGTPLMVDVEPTGTSRPTLADAVAFIKAYRQAGGTTHLVYFPHWYWEQLGSPSLAPLTDLNMALWSSAYTGYTDSSTGTGWRPYGGMTPKIWQYTNRLHFNGQDIDFNAFRGTHGGDQSGGAVADTLDQFKSLAKTGRLSVHKPSPKPPVPPAMRLAKGNESLRHAVNREGTTVNRALWLMAAVGHADDGRFGQPNQAEYVVAGDFNAIMPQGMVYWVG